TSASAIYTLSLHDALPICQYWRQLRRGTARAARLLGRLAGSVRRGLINDCSQMRSTSQSIVFVINSLTAGGAERVLVDVLAYLRSEEHTSELQSRSDLVCR